MLSLCQEWFTGEVIMAKGKSAEVEKTLRAVHKILAAEGKDLRVSLYQDIILNALKCQRDDLDILDLKIINRALAEFRHAACVFKPYRLLRKVSIFGSAREPKGSPRYDLAVKTAHRLVEKGFMVITGAASGIMKAGIEGAGLRNSFGVNILLPFERGLAKIIRDDPKVMKFKYFFTRKIFFVMEADAVILFPGGFGTHDEGFEVLTLLQTGKAPPMPIVLMELSGEDYWETWDRFIKEQLLARGFISAEDLSFYKIARSPEEATDCITSYYSTYHSLRQVRDKLVIRLEKELKDAHVGRLNDMFLDLIESGKIFKTPALPEEKDEPNLRSRPRIAFAYKRKGAGRLNEMILTINSLGRSA
jgi:uncharacterized protein (TIGR00730 family)